MQNYEMLKAHKIMIAGDLVMQGARTLLSMYYIGFLWPLPEIVLSYGMTRVQWIESVMMMIVMSTENTYSMMSRLNEARANSACHMT